MSSVRINVVCSPYNFALLKSWTGQAREGHGGSVLDFKGFDRFIYHLF